MATVANFDFHCNLDPVILWQYQEAEKLKALVASQQSFLDTAIQQLWNDFNRDFLNIQTCGSAGLSMWGQLLQVPRPTYENEAGEIVDFSDDQYRLVLRARIYLLTFDGSVKALNQFFKILFPDLDVVITDNYNMTVTISILNDLPSEYAVLFEKPFVDTFLPRPAGVRYIIGAEEAVSYEDVFTFEGFTDSQGNPGGNFDNGTFIA